MWIQNFLIRGSNLQRGFDLLILPDCSLFFPDFSENSAGKFNNLVSKGDLREPHEPPRSN